MKNSDKVQISFRAATVRERVVTREWHRMKKRISHPLADARGSVWVSGKQSQFKLLKKG
jgi:hypothetical protein